MSSPPSDGLRLMLLTDSISRTHPSTDSSSLRSLGKVFKAGSEIKLAELLQWLGCGWLRRVSVHLALQCPCLPKCIWPQWGRIACQLWYDTRNVCVGAALLTFCRVFDWGQHCHGRCFAPPNLNLSTESSNNNWEALHAVCVVAELCLICLF